MELDLEGQLADRFSLGPELKQAKARLANTELLGKAKIPGLAYENPDGSSLKIDNDYFGKKRSEAAPAPGPFEKIGTNPIMLKQ